ncbi:hypothetical protein GALMADRAFT_64035 [Galerina marginata CBS 339.88]|uniref:pyranose dehydrogenase (acceptor) n=1 Tax=Galerina marginata (strain CBS 339.88) TaxID=685588 RepID=A0A067TFY6_GALM3|nr:hypothetical protein GALMADRAFT_64035 [Galerina marginata CBS 339.88]
MSSLPRSIEYLTDGLNALLEKLLSGQDPFAGVISNLTPTTRALLSGAAITIILKLYLGKPTKSGRYITDLEEVGRSLGGRLPDYDIIVVGGGTAGCALASRLTENPNIRVLLLESGGSGRALADSRTPASFARLYRVKKHVHNFWTELQRAANGVKKFWPRAKMLGGCKLLQAAQYGAPGDFDQWASIIGDDSWLWKNCSQYFRKFESYQPHPDFPLVDRTVHGNSGPIQVGFNNRVSGWCDNFVKACLNLGIPSTNDFNAPNGLIGAARQQYFLTFVRYIFYERVSSESAYLTPDVLARPNLKVAINATATRIMFEQQPGKYRAAGVEFTSSEHGQRFLATAKKEVVISAGAVQSPHILLLSGIGPAAHLKSHGIPVVRDLPGVGANLVDHPIVDMHFQQKGLVESVRFMNPTNIREGIRLVGALIQYYVLGMGGHLAMNFGEAAAFVRTDDPVLFPASEYPEKLVDSTSAKDSPDLELFETPVAYKEHGSVFFNDFHTFGLHVYLLRPTSHGTVRLASPDPFAHPKVDPNYLSTREDRLKLLRGVRLCLKLAHAEPLNSLLDHSCTDPQFDHQLHLKSDVELEEVVRERVETVYHPTSSCRMAPLEKGGVVDAQLKVYGVDRLRVCDASIFPSIISGHTAGACYATAEKLADQIKAEFQKFQV